MAKTTKPLTSAQRGVNLFNDARKNSSNEYMRATGEVTVATSISHAMTPIVKYAPFMNEFLHYVVNKIVIQSVESKMYTNQYEMLKKEGFPLGTDLEMNYVNPAMGRDYDISLGATLLQVTKPDVKTCYFRQNRRRQFPVTIPRELMEGAFTSWEQLDSMVTGMVTSLFSGNEIEEENLIKKLIQTSVKNNVVIKKEIPWNEADPAAASVGFIKTIQKIALDITHASSNFNNYQAYATAQGIADVTPAITWTPSENLYLFIRSDVLVNCNVETLAGAFNMSKADLVGRVTPFPDFNYLDFGSPVDPVTKYWKTITDDQNILAVLTDVNTFEYRDNLSTSGDFYNSAGLYQNQYLNVWQTYGIRPWGNAVAICKQA